MSKKCKRCGCDFPNIEIHKKGCSDCETPKEMFKRTMNKLRELTDKKEAKDE